MTDEQFKTLESEVNESLEGLTDNNTILIPLNYLSNMTGLTFDVLEAQIDRILARKGLNLCKMRDKDASGQITRMNYWKP